jgi:aspartyl/asparaginyl beta-hydroxylase (cupin superfamily)
MTASAPTLQMQVQQALAQRNAPTALALLRQAEVEAPGDIDIKMQKAMALRMSGDIQGAIDALDAALALEPYNFVALLSKGALVERTLSVRHAATIYRNALKIIPTDPPAAFQGAIARARQVIQETNDALAAHLEAKTSALGLEMDPATQARFDEGLQIFAGKARIYNSEAILLTYPRLPAIPFYDRSLFPWLAELEAATDTIREELEGALAQDEQEFAPYIAYRPGDPVNQWGELNHSRRWSSYFLWKDGARQDAACERCPKTAALLDRLPLARQPGFAPTAMFSALDAHTHIPPHTGSTNIRLLVHLPLILPGPARFRVGNETRSWEMGQAWAFDDTIEHEAWNDADKLRVILIIDVWNPYLSEAERELVTAMLHAKNQFFGL